MMKEKMKAIIAHLKKIVADGVLSYLKDVVKNNVRLIVTVVLGLAGAVTVSNPEMVGKMYRTITRDESAQTIKLLHSELAQLRGEFKSAEQTNFYERKMFQQAFKKFAETTDKNFRIIHDSLLRQNKRLMSFQAGSGTVKIDGGGEIKSGSFSDNWIDAYVEMDTGGRALIDYQMNFRVKDVGVTYKSDTDGSTQEIYSVTLQSLKDTSATYPVGDYKRWVMSFAEEPKAEPKKQPDALNLNVAYSGWGVEVGLSYSAWTFGNFRLPDVGISSDFQESVNVSAGARYNVGAVVPLLQDFWIGLHYGWNVMQHSSGPVLIIGTTL